MARTSNRALARQLGVSETAVRRAERAGRIRRESDGSWDAARVKAAWSDNTDQAQQRPPRQRSNRPRRATLKPVPETAVGAVRDTLREHGEPVSAAGMTFMQARTANEVLKAQERRLRLQQMKGELVDRPKAVAQVFRLAREERDAWVNWRAQVTTLFRAGMAGRTTSRAADRVVNAWLARDGSGETRASDRPMVGTTRIAEQEIPLTRFTGFPPCAAARGDIEAMSLLAGQSVGLMNDVRLAAELVHDLVNGAAPPIPHRLAGIAAGSTP